MKYALLFVGLLFIALILELTIAPREGRTKYFFVLAEVLIASVILGIAVAHATSIR
jgi:hypothetical protein